jgi:hypothetical protein
VYRRQLKKAKVILSKSKRFKKMKKMFQVLEEIEAKVEIQKKLKRKSQYPK